MQAAEWEYDSEASSKPEFIIDNDFTADWAIRKILDARRERDMFVAHYKAQIDRANERCVSSEAILGAKLEQYFATVPRKETKTQQSYKLPSGKLVRKAPRVTYKPDDQALVEWLKARGYTDYIKTTETPRWGDYKPKTQVVGGEVVDIDTGEIVTGVQVVMTPEEFRVEG